MQNYGKIEYDAALPEMVISEMQKIYENLELMLNDNLTFEETLFYASMLQLVFVKIHAFEDGKGRTARLLKNGFWGKN